jgi:methionyl-tRNA formyltransferase
MGTPEFAVASLDALVKEGYDIAGVITAPDKPAGRGMKMNTSAVKQYAVEHSLTILQPEKLKNPQFLEELKNLHADVQIVVAFRMLPDVVWNMPRMGTINVHASLLPKYRGAAPINWAIINGEKETGVTTFLLTHEIDTGNILLQDKVAIDDDENAGTLHDKLKMTGAQLLLKTISGVMNGDVAPRKQSDAEVTHAPRIYTDTCKIDWNKSAESVHNLIRGLSPYPAAFTVLQNKIFKIYRSSFEVSQVQIPAGSVVTDNKSYLRFSAADGYVYAKEVQIEGKKRMSVEDFLKGFRQQ